MRQKMSLNAKQELAKSVAPRYRGATWSEKGGILDEFVAVTGYARKHAIAVLERGDDRPQPICRCRKPPFVRRVL